MTSNLEKSLICLVGTWRPTASIMEQRLILFLKTLIELKGQGTVIKNKAFEKQIIQN
jgi:hypothetical protein